MSTEPQFIDLLRAIATDPAARGLADDAAVLELGGERLVLTQDALIEGVHFRRDDPPGDVAWKLVAVNMSDLAAKGARPIACLMSYGLTGDRNWDAAFVAGLGEALDAHGAALIGGDTVSQPKGEARVLSLTALGRSSGPIPPSRSGAQADDALYVTGPIGEGWAGLILLEHGRLDPPELIEAYRRPRALLAEGVALAQVARAMMDVSDGLLIDAHRMAAASQLAVEIEIGAVPLSPAYIGTFGNDRTARMQAMTGGDDYQLIFAADAEAHLPVTAHRIGRFRPGSGLTLTDNGEQVPVPDRLGWLHRA